MDSTIHDIADLFGQLGLPNGQDEIEAFVATHRPMPGATRLADAPFWTAAQSRFLRDEILEDADWAEVVDRLNVMLHA